MINLSKSYFIRYHIAYSKYTHPAQLESYVGQVDESGNL